MEKDPSALFDRAHQIMMIKIIHSHIHKLCQEESNSNSTSISPDSHLNLDAIIRTFDSNGQLSFQDYNIIITTPSQQKDDENKENDETSDWH